MRILLTGGAGFIGFHATLALLKSGHSVTAVDNMNAYYDPALKLGRLSEIGQPARYRLVRADIAQDGAVAQSKRNVFDLERSGGRGWPHAAVLDAKRARARARRDFRGIRLPVQGERYVAAVAFALDQHEYGSSRR